LSVNIVLAFLAFLPPETQQVFVEFLLFGVNVVMGVVVVVSLEEEWGDVCEIRMFS